MELWVRSQDKTTLEKIDTIQICQNPDNTWFFNTGLVIGTYKSKERALEVLDEIQYCIDFGIPEKKWDSVGMRYYEVLTQKNVYEMPKE